MSATAVPQPIAMEPSASVVIITDVDGILRHDDRRTLAEARHVLHALAGTRLVLCSNRSAQELQRVQRELGIRQPFISDGGAALHIPQGYFFCSEATAAAGAEAPMVGGPLDAAVADEYETIDFGVRRLGHAVRLLVELFRTCPDPPVVIGIGVEWRDRVLLQQVDVPVVIRDPAVDQSGLLRHITHAYVTTACGGAGFAEAVFGHGSVGRA